jgi:hypothetical protein
MSLAEQARYASSRDNLLELQAHARSLQERADNALAPWGLRAPALVAGQSLDTYRRDLDVLMKKQLRDGHPLRKVQYRALDSDALGTFEAQLIPAVRSEAFRPDSVAKDTIREVVDVDQNGLKVHRFIGLRSFIHDFARPGRKARIRNPDTDPGWFRR